MRIRLRRTLHAALLLALVPAGVTAQTESWPAKGVRVIVGFTPGSATDISARLISQKLGEVWNVPVTVENVPGAGGAVGLARVAKSPADGYTLAWAANGAVTMVPGLTAKPLYDPVRDFAPVTLAYSMPSVIAVNNDVPATTFQELVALAKASPGKLAYATPGAGTPQHIGGELLKSVTGIDLAHVPYKGAQFTDVIGGRVPVTIQNVGAILQTLRDGKLRPLAVTSLNRSPNMPDWPTVAESGVPGFEAVSWFSFLAPAGTPSGVVDRMHRDTLRVLADPGIRARTAQLGMDTVGSTPDELARTIRTDLEKWAKVIREAGITAGD